MKRIGLLLCLMLMSTSAFSKDAGDTLWSRNSLRFDVFGKALAGVGVTFERNLLKKHPQKHPWAFTSVEAGISYPYWKIPSLFTSIGINRNWMLGSRGKIILNAGIYVGSLISFNPTPKSIRQVYKETNFYGGWVTNPIEPWLVGDLGIKYVLGRWFAKLSFTPVLYYHSFERQFFAGPWAGISFGFKLR